MGSEEKDTMAEEKENEGGEEEEDDDDDGPPPGFHFITPQAQKEIVKEDKDEEEVEDGEGDDDEDSDGPPPGWSSILPPSQQIQTSGEMGFSFRDIFCRLRSFFLEIGVMFSLWHIV